MERPSDKGVITCPPDSLGNPRPDISTTSGETWVASKMMFKGSIGVTCRDFNGADLRHYIRALKNKGVGIHDEWETDAFGKHKRWFIKPGYSLRRIPKKTKPTPQAKVRVSNSNSKADGLNEALNNG